MIAGAHTILFAEDAERARAFLRDGLGFEGIDAGDGWGRGPGHHASPAPASSALTSPGTRALSPRFSA
jgi:catechol 2,3-dioxygenase-like lactoylglutathione lyase family enzyme